MEWSRFLGNLGVGCMAWLMMAAGLPCRGEHVLPGLGVDEKGNLIKDGAPFRGIGVHGFDLFYRCLKDQGDVSYREALKTLADLEIPRQDGTGCGKTPFRGGIRGSGAERQGSGRGSLRIHAARALGCRSPFGCIVGI